MEAYTKKLADFCAGLRYEDIPQRVVSKIKWCILDNLGIILGATRTRFGQAILGYTQLLGDQEQATVLGFGLKTSAMSAAFANGSLSETLEYQDGYTKGGYHPCCGTISASLATAEWRQSTGRDLIAAVTAGYEVGNRVSEAIFPSHLSRGFQPTGTAGAVGAAAAASAILKLDREQTCNALGIAGFILPISTGDNLWGGYTIKPVHGGAAAKAGIESALLASRGLNAAPLEGDPKIGKGFLRIVSDQPKWERITEGLETFSTIAELYFKPFALCRVIHAPVEVAIDLRNRYGLKPEDIREVVVRTYDFAAEVPGQTRTSPESDPTLCQFSLPYGVAAALMYGEVGLEQMMGKATQDPRIHDLAGRVQVIHDPEMDRLRPALRPASVQVTFQDGRKVSGRVDFPKGDARNPLTEEELLTKFSNLARDVVGEEKVRKIQEAVFALEKINAVEELVRLLK
ncbi:MAG: MmgE/PrpD family protein [Deltaproteobacteria bacterium]|nr:MmgE/PrpD family protein [Deltaproteobacteria bacterium]